MARGRDRAEKQLVRAVDLGLHDPAFLVGERVIVALQRHVPAERDRLPIDEELGEQAAGDELAGQHADRSGQRSRPCHDPLTGRRHQVATRPRHRAHRDHQRLALGDELERLAHRFGCGRRAAPRVDEQHRGRRALVGGDLARHRHHGQIAGAVIAGQRDVDGRLHRQAPAAAVDDRSLDSHHGHVPSATGRWARRAQPAAGLVPRRDPGELPAFA